MSAFVTLAPVLNMSHAPNGAASLSAPSATRYPHALERFLAEVELKAFRMARAVLRHDDDALDAVQDAMMQLARAYAARPADEWKPLFYRILENKIRDQQRRRKVRNRVMAWLPFRRNEDGEEMPDPLAQAASALPEPGRRLELEEAMQALERGVGALPARQRQAFMLRNLEGLDVEQTAIAMNCSQGSVKTHYFRALRTLRAQLGNFV
jgi:RNA polymerase sigma-70 factor (ECF subfamily)